MNDWTTQQLLREYVQRQSEPAFAELVRRHVDLVYSAALRMVCDSHLAQDVTQATFVAFARSAPQLVDYPVLSGWLHRTAQHLAVKTVRTDVRRRAREQEAVMMSELPSADTSVAWEQIASHLDAGLGDLDDADRDAVMLRYFERKSAQEMAQALGISAEAAQKRVSRAVERLREFFHRRGITVSASGFAAVVSANAVQSAPVGLLATISTTALATSSVTSTAVKTLAMTALQKTIIGAALAVAVGTGVYQTIEVSKLRAQLDTMRAGHVPELRDQQEMDAAHTAALLAQNQQAATNTSELMRLRAEVARLRAAEQEWKGRLAALPVPDPTPPAAERDVREGDELPVNTWSDAGFATPRDALRTRGWAVLNGNDKRFKESIVITDSARKTLEDMFLKMAAASTDPDKERIIQEIANSSHTIEDAFLLPMMAQHRSKGFTGYRITSEQFISPDETLLEVETEMAKGQPNKEPMKFRRFGAEWKVVIDDDFVNAMMKEGSGKQ